MTASHKTFFMGISSVLLGFLLVGCSAKMAENVRKVTYPPEFRYIEPQELRSDMARLAQHLRTLELAMMQNPEKQREEPGLQRQKVLMSLNNIEKVASRLQAGDAGSSHPFMQDYMQDFVRIVGEAKIAASLPQPRYYFAGQVAGGCANCHKINR